MKKNYLLSALVGVAISSTAQMGMYSDQLTFSSKLDGTQSGITTNASGVGAFTLNATMDTICYEVTLNGLSGAITNAHLHNGVMGQNGGVAVPLMSGIDNNKITGIITGSELSDNLPSFLSGGLYINIHTAANPAGEIRGQVYLEKEMLFKAELGTGSTLGLGTFMLSQDKSMVNYLFVADGLSGAITNAHLHYGAIGQSGPVAIPLMGDIVTGLSVLKGSFNTTPDLIDSLMSSKVYINIHTAANPAGEIRGQLNKSNNLAFDAMIDTTQQVGSVNGITAMGVSILEISNTLDTLYYNTLTTGLSGTINNIHIHNGVTGVNGPVLEGLMSGINGNQVKGFVEGTSITSDFITKLLRGETYINIHTTANPAGEIRGQVYKYARDGYRISMSGEQQVPSITVGAQGSGFISVDRMKSNAHIMVAISGLTGNATAAHLHNAVEGQNGGVEYNLVSLLAMSSTDETITGFWKSTDAMPFTSTQESLLQSESIYINVHTTANPAGEMRGQAKMSATCSTLTSTLVEEKNKSSFVAYPNPTNSIVTLEAEGLVNVTIFSIDGKIVKQLSDINSNNITLNLSDIENGIYTVIAQFANNNQEVIRIIKK